MPDLVPNFLGHVLALEAQTGKVVWDMLLVSPPRNGVAVWSSFAVDPDIGALYFATGNNYTGEPSELSDSVIAVNAKTGATIWARQVTEQDVWTPADPVGPDVDFGAGPQLFNATIGGAVRPLLGIGQKTGHYMAFDRRTGEPVWSTVVGLAGVGGGTRGEAGAGDDRIVVWSNNSWDDVGPPKNPGDFPIDVEALDPATGRRLWSQPKSQPAVGWSGGYLAAHVFFVGSLDGTIKGYDADDGTIVTTVKTPGAVGSALLVEGNTLFVGAGVPPAFGGGPGTNGLFAFSPTR